MGILFAFCASALSPIVISIKQCNLGKERAIIFQRRHGANFHTIKPASGHSARVLTAMPFTIKLLG